MKPKNSPHVFGLENAGYVKGQGIYIVPGVQSDFSYSDGEQAENFLLESIQKSNDLSVGSEELQKYIHDWPSRYHLSSQRPDLLRPFANQLKNKKVLEIGAGAGAITRFLGELGCSVLALEGSLQRARITSERCRHLENVTVVNDNFENFSCNEKFDFVILIGVLEYANTFMTHSDNGPFAMLTKAKEFLTDKGELVLAIENKIGLKYWAGAPEDHIGKEYYNIQNLYADNDAKTFGYFELISLLEQAGFNISEFMFPFPDYKFAEIIITEAGFRKREFNPLELLLEKFEYFQKTGYTSRFNSNLAAYSLFNNGQLSYFANSFLITATTSQGSRLKKESPILAYVYSNLRKKQYCKQTTFLSNSDGKTISVTRQRLYKGTDEHSPCLQHVLQDEPYIKGRILSASILPIISSDGWAIKNIVNWCRPFYDILISKSFDKDGQAWLSGKYLDLAPFNIILDNEQPKIFDLEWICNEDIPAYYVFFRGLAHSLGRILFVNDPEDGTPLQITELATEVTKYYFQFADAELLDCKSREIKYFSAVAPCGMTEPFPLHQLNVRNSDYLRLLKTNEELLIQNETLANELNRTRQQFDSEKIALLEEAIKKQQQFDSEKVALLEEAVKTQQQFDSEKVALLEEAIKKQEQFDSEKIALLAEAKKKQEQYEIEVASFLEEARKRQEQFETEKTVLLTEAQKRQDKFEREKIDLSNDAKKKQQQLETEKAVLLNVAKKKQEQFDTEKIALLDEARRKQEQFDSEKASLLDEMTKNETRLLDEISDLKKSIKWYADTYETRSILGVLKEKIKSKPKKRVAQDISSQTSSGNPLPDTEDAALIEKSQDRIDAQIPAIELLKLDETIPSTDILGIKYQSASVAPSDVCLFSSFSFSGKVEEYVYYYLSELQKAGLSIVFISTSPIAESCVGRLSQYAFLIIERENKCPDFGSWKAGLSMLDWGKNLNSVLLTNDSVFGPLADLNNIISFMKDKYDVWGMSDNYEIDYHLQSYFLYFNKGAIASDTFRNFWKNVDLSATKDDVIHKYEIGLSRLFRKTNFTLGAYVNIDVVSKDAVHGHKIINPLLVFWKSLIKKHEFPFFKRELIIKRNISKTYDDHRDLYVNISGWRKIIQECSYPVKLIEDFLSNYCKVIKAGNDNIVLKKRKVLFLIDPTEEADAQRVLLGFLQWLKSETGIEAELLSCKEGNSELALEFSKFGIVTNFYAVSEGERKNLKGRLIDEVSLIFSNTIRNVDIQKFLSFLDVPQIIFVHETTQTLDNILSGENTKWVRDNISQFITTSDVVWKHIVDYIGVDRTKVSLVNKSDDFTMVQAPTLLGIINTYYDDKELRLAEDPLLAFMTHIYYDNSWIEIRDKLKNFNDGKNYFLFSISEGCIIRNEIIENIKETFTNAFFLVTPNVGRDIGGKMTLIDLYLFLGIKSSYIIILHDKQSIHSLEGESWKNNLFKIFDINNQSRILNLFRDPAVGIIGIKDHIVNEYNATTHTFRNNNQLSKKLLKQFNISIENYDFMGGCIFWIKSSIIEKFFMKNNPILIRGSLEPGNVLDLHGERLTHTWERMFSWIATSDGYRVDGI